MYRLVSTQEHACPQWSTSLSFSVLSPAHVVPRVDAVFFRAALNCDMLDSSASPCSSKYFRVYKGGHVCNDLSDLVCAPKPVAHSRAVCLVQPEFDRRGQSLVDAWLT